MYAKQFQNGKISHIMHTRHSLSQQSWITEQTNYIPQNYVASFYYEFMARYDDPLSEQVNEADSMINPPHQVRWGLIILVWLLFIASVTVLLVTIYHGNTIRIGDQIGKFWV